MIPSLLVLGKARRLDRSLPGWADRINLDSLDFDSNEDCVLGQLYGSMLVAPLRVGGMCLFPLLLSLAFLGDLFSGTRKEKTWISCIKKRQTTQMDKPLYVPFDWKVTRHETSITASR